MRDFPERPSLDHYRKEAKQLLKQYQAAEPDAVARIRLHHPRFRAVVNASRRGFALADAQWVLAREHGFDSWPKFVRHVNGTIDVQDMSPAVVQLPVDREVNLCVFLDDGTRVLTAVEAEPVRLWDAATGTLLRTFDSYSNHAWALRPVDDGRIVLIGCRDGSVRVVSTATGGLAQLLTGHTAMVRCLDVSADRRFAISGAAMRDHALRVWDLERARCIQVLDGHRDGVYTAAFDAGQQRALSGSRDATVRVWDLASGRCLRVLDGHAYHVHAVAWAADGRRVLSCSQDIRLWDVDTGRCLRVFEGHTETIRSLAWSTDGRQVLSAAHDRTIRIWDVERGTCRQTLDGHSTGVITAVWSANGRRVFSCDWSGQVRRWDLSAAAAV